jgi:putative hemolysin/PKD repeat protein
MDNFRVRGYAEPEPTVEVVSDETVPPQIVSVEILNVNDIPTNTFTPGDTVKVKATICNMLLCPPSQNPDYKVTVSMNIDEDTDGSNGAIYDSHLTGDDWNTVLYTGTHESSTWSWVVPPQTEAVKKYYVAVGIHDQLNYYDICYDCPGYIWDFEAALPDLLPDLTLSPDDITFSNQNPEVGDTVTITATILNIGEADVEQMFFVSFFDGAPENNDLIDSIHLSNIEACGTAIAAVSYEIESEEAPEIFVVVDSDEDIYIAESNEENNVASRMLYIIPSKFDWRDLGVMTPVKAQGFCPACSAFAAVGSVEAKYNIEQGDILNIDLSEYDLYSNVVGEDYGEPIAISAAMEYIRDFGIVDEDCFPHDWYLPDGFFQPQERCNDWPTHLWSCDIIDGYNDFDDIKHCKLNIYNKGPLAVGVNDFSGTGKEGGHAVVFVGWDDSKECFIFKNSWGTHWGIWCSGYGEISYNRCDDFHRIKWADGVNAPAIMDPSAVYCDALGYEYVIVSTAEGECGYCKLPDGQLVDSWKFLQGEEGQECSYCALKGYEMKTVYDGELANKFLTGKCAVCVLEDGSEVEVTELMGLSFDWTIWWNNYYCSRPVFDSIDDIVINEGDLVEIVLEATDPDNDPLTYSISRIPDGASFSGDTFRWTPSYDQAGIYELPFCVCDGELENFEIVKITVNDVKPDLCPPTIESVTLDAYTTIPGATIHVTVEATDNVAVTSVTADGIALVETGSTWEGDITAPSATGDYTLTIIAEDAAGNVAETAVDYSVVTAPLADSNGPYADNEGSQISFDASGSYDPDGSIDLYEWDFDSDGVYDVSSASSTAIFTWGDDYTGTVELRVTDNDGLSDTDTASIMVNNVAPTASIVSVEQPGDFILPYHSLTFNGAFIDAGWLDTQTATWDFGDGTIVSGTLTEENDQPDATGTTTAEHAYAEPGTYSVTLTVTDDDDGIGHYTTTVTVISAEEAAGIIIDQLGSSIVQPGASKGVSQKIESAIDKLEQVIDFLEQGKYCDAIGKLDGMITQIEGAIDQVNEQRCSVKECKGKECNCIADKDANELIENLEHAKEGAIAIRDLISAEHPECA